MQAINLRQHQIPRHTCQMPGLLKSLGVMPKRDPRNRGLSGHSFWLRPYNDLLAIYENAGRAFRCRAKQLRTDQVANHDRSVALIATWRTIQKRFAEHKITLG